MLFEWLSREGWIVFSWWLLVTLAGVAVLPLCARLLGGLPDKGYTLARAAGMLLVGFVFWLLASLGFLNNTPGSVLLSWLIVLVVSLAVYLRSGERLNLREWWRENRRVVIVGELIFAVLLLGWAIFRAHQNGLTGTEKPMELAFMSAILRSETFPPNDPWMSGYAISYYYFGYVFSAVLSMMSGISTTIGFNMTISTVFALTGLTSFGVVYNLVRSRAFRPGGAIRDNAPTNTAPLLVGLLATVFMIFLGNFQLPLIEAPYNSQSVPEDYFRFWGIDRRDQYYGDVVFDADNQPNILYIEDPALWTHWWWFRASRVLTDYDLNGENFGGAQPIDEFPQFSFLLSDNHPHVLSMPFVLLILGMALNLLLTWRDPNRSEIILYGICLGGLIFANLDGAIYIVVLVGVDALRRIMRSAKWRLGLLDWLELVKLGVAIGLIAIVAYLPFFIGFRSHASGFLPNLIFPTLFRRYFIMFGPFILILAVFLVVEVWRGQRRTNWKLGLQITVLLFVALALVWGMLVVVGALTPQMQSYVNNFVTNNGDWENVLPALLQRRILYGLTTVVLLAGVALIIGRLFPRSTASREEKENGATVDYPPATGFALILVGVGIILCLVPEFLYTRDNFSMRINTIFKFYFQAWIVFSLAGAYAVYTILADHDLRLPRFGVRAAFSGMFAVILLLGLTYPVLGIHNRMFIETGHANAESPAPLSLDGGPYMIAPGDYGAIMCLNELVEGSDVVALEAADPGSAYNPRYGRVGALTGIPIVLGWGNHEAQWRGSTYSEILGTRPADIDRIYTDLRWDVVSELVDRYSINYILYGETERSKYGASGEEKFLENLEVVCESGNTRIYHVTERALTGR